jgi:hypothetical protein
MSFGAFTLQNFMTTNLTRDPGATPKPERLTQTITAKDLLYPVAFKYAEQTGFDLETAAEAATTFADGSDRIIRHCV